MLNKKSLRHSVNRIGSYEAIYMGKKASSLDYEIPQLLLDLKTTTCINIICNIYCVDL